MHQEITNYNKFQDKFDKCRSDEKYLWENIESIKNEVEQEIKRLKNLGESGVFYWYIGTYTKELGILKEVYSINKKIQAAKKYPKSCYNGDSNLIEITKNETMNYENQKVKKSIEATNYYMKAINALKKPKEPWEFTAYTSCILDRLTVIGEYSPILSLLENISLSQAIERKEYQFDLEALIQLDYKYFLVLNYCFRYSNAGTNEVKKIFESNTKMRLQRMLSNIDRMGSYSDESQNKWIRYLNESKFLTKPISNETIKVHVYNGFALYNTEEELVASLVDLNKLFKKDSIVLQDFKEKQSIFRKDLYTELLEKGELIISDPEFESSFYKKSDIIIELYNYIDKISYLVFQNIPNNVPEHEWDRKKLIDNKILLVDEPRYRYLKYLYNYLDENQSNGKFVIDELEVIRSMRNNHTHKWTEVRISDEESKLDNLLDKIRNITLALLLTYYTAEQIEPTDTKEYGDEEYDS